MKEKKTLWDGNVKEKKNPLRFQCDFWAERLANGPNFPRKLLKNSKFCGEFESHIRFALRDRISHFCDISFNFWDIFLSKFYFHDTHAKYHQKLVSRSILCVEFDFVVEIEFWCFIRNEPADFLGKFWFLRKKSGKVLVSTNSSVQAQSWSRNRILRTKLT